MRNPFVYAVGGVVSADIAVPEHEREVAFYSKVLTTGEEPLWREDLMNNLGLPVIGLGKRIPEYESLPLQWMPHFQVSDVGASVEATLAAGGKVIMQSEGGEPANQWACLIDPDGVCFGIITVVDSNEPLPSERCGKISWFSLNVPDAQKSRKFYEKVIGWKAKPLDLSEEDSCSIRIEMQIDSERSAAEICQPHNQQTPALSQWLMHLPVADLAESLRRVSECGGEVIHEHSTGNNALIRDPIGVYFVIQSE